MKNYHEMSDHEINKEVLKIIKEDLLKDGWRIVNYSHSSDKRSAGIYKKSIDVYSWYDFVGDIESAWTIMLENKISLLWDETNSMCMATVASMFDLQTCRRDGASHTNPLRAAMIVFLMIKEKENI